MLTFVGKADINPNTNTSNSQLYRAYKKLNPHLTILRYKGAVLGNCEFCECKFHLDRQSRRFVVIETVRLSAVFTRAESWPLRVSLERQQIKSLPQD